MDIFKPDPIDPKPVDMYKKMVKTCPVCKSTCSADGLKNNNKCHNCSADISDVKMTLILGRSPKKDGR